MSIYFVVCVVVTLFVSFVLLEPSQVMLPNMTYVVCYVGPLEARPEGSKPPVMSMPAATTLPSPIVEDDYQPEGA